jgi:DNA-binding NtrC family response regulator
VVHRGYVLSDGPTLTAQALRSVLDGDPGPTAPVGAPPTASAPVDPGILQIRIGESLEEIERRTLQKTLESVGGNKRRAAEILGISLKTIYNKLKRFGL